MARRSDDFSGRIRVVGGLIFIIAVIVVYRLFDLQIVSGESYRNEAKRQYLASSSKSPIASRGAVYFREKNGQLVSAAVVKEGYLMAINPSVLENAEEARDKISEIVSIDRDDFLKRAAKKSDTYGVIGRRLDSKTAELIGSLAIRGVDLIPEQWRFYPGGKLASHVLGFVGYKDNSLVGRYGIERYYEDYLRGTDEDAINNYFSDAFLGLSRDLFSRQLDVKKDIILTLEPKVQSFLEDSLESAMNQYSAKSAGGIIVDPTTGKILAMAAKPDFDPNFYNKVKDHSLFLNPLVSSVFEMGSVFKPITVAAGLDQDKINSQTTFNDNGYLIIDRARIENYDTKARGKVDMQAVLNKSLNTGAVFAMRQLGRDSFKNYLLNFGFNEKSGVDLPDEARGNLAGLNSSREIEYATASFGQGIALTPIAFSSAFSALANGGFLVQPYIIETDQSKSPAKKQVLKKETSEEITRMLVNVVDEALLDGKVKLDHYSVAAKTGTAQIPEADRRGYEKDSYLHTFIGYVPGFDAKFLTFLYLEKPQGVRYAAYSLTPAFMDITKFLLNYYEVPPDR